MREEDNLSKGESVFGFVLIDLSFSVKSFVAYCVSFLFCLSFDCGFCYIQIVLLLLYPCRQMNPLVQRTIRLCMREEDNLSKGESVFVQLERAVKDIDVDLEEFRRLKNEYR
jgi:hypothetical protein